MKRLVFESGILAGHGCIVAADGIFPGFRSDGFHHCQTGVPGFQVVAIVDVVHDQGVAPGPAALRGIVQYLTAIIARTGLEQFLGFRFRNEFAVILAETLHQVAVLHLQICIEAAGVYILFQHARRLQEHTRGGQQRRLVQSHLGDQIPVAQGFRRHHPAVHRFRCIIEAEGLAESVELAEMGISFREGEIPAEKLLRYPCYLLLAEQSQLFAVSQGLVQTCQVLAKALFKPLVPICAAQCKQDAECQDDCLSHWVISL